MRNVAKCRHRLGRLLLLLFVLISGRLAAKPGTITMGDTDPSFPVLQTRTGAYTNVTVTKKTRDWIFIIHSTGVCNVKVADLSPETRVALGYDAPPKKDGDVASSGSKDSSDSAKNHTLAQIAHFKLSDVRNFAGKWRQNQKAGIAELKHLAGGSMLPLYIFLCLLLLLHLISSTCAWTLCRKTHNSPGPLVWVPVLQLIPLLRAANMARVWFFAFFIPVLNIIAYAVWSVKITKCRGKSPWVALWLILPPTSGLAYLYLVLSASAPVTMESNEVMALETA
ncbi:MAG TPA: hypothetical protein VN873_05950 [Candidatus Angelobacter sp.]|nr:hypothetical protein [Candidatus Angelobacter sp.]